MSKLFVENYNKIKKELQNAKYSHSLAIRAENSLKYAYLNEKIFDWIIKIELFGWIYNKRLINEKPFQILKEWKFINILAFNVWF